MNKTRYYLWIGLATLAVFIFSNACLRGYLRSDVSLAKELKSPPGHAYQYRLANEAPFKYRMLFPAIVKGSHDLLFDANDNRAFYRTYLFWSAVFLITAACLLFNLMTVAGIGTRWSLASSLVFILMPPVLMAYTLPVHTREDPLAYCLLFLGLAALLKQRRVLFVAVCVVGVLCRETLLLLPLLYFFFAEDNHWPRRFLIPFIPGAVWISVRLLMGRETYDTWEGLRWNLNNPDQVVGFLFITFSFAWLLFLVQYTRYFKKKIMPAGRKLFFYRSGLFTLTVILITTFVGGIYNEIRLLYLFSPWMLFFLADALEGGGKALASIWQTSAFRVVCIGALLVSGAAMYYTLRNQEALIQPGPYAVPYHLWIVVACVYIFVTIAFIPVSLRLYALENPQKSS